MKFKKIKILGFKSFVDQTDFDIEHGLTGIVGPNGCGKSNVVESLRWCMGETSPKSMRSSGMEDVIFSGTSDRPARNNAEVTIFLDNQDRSAPAEFNNEEEIQIKRKIEIDKGSEYRINGKEVRARDVQRLFADLSTGAHSPSLISQGRVGALINAKPIDRRAVLEEAAGISGLHSRRHEAELKLKGAETNLQRLKDIMKQLNAQVSSLRKQAEQAETYKNISQEIERLEGIVMYLKWYNLKDSFEKSDGDLKNSEQLIREFTLQVTQATTLHAQANEKIKPLREKEIEAAAKLNRINLERESLDKEEERIKELKNSLEQSLQQIIGDLERENYQLEEAGKDLEALENRKDELGDAVLISNELNKQSTQVRHIKEEASDIRKKIDDKSNYIADQRAELKSTEVSIQEIEEKSFKLNEKIINIKDDLTSMGYSEEDLATNDDDHKVSLLKDEKNDLEIRISNLEEDIKKYESIKTTSRDDWQRTEVSSENIKTRETTLKEVEEYDNPLKWTSLFKEKFYNSLRDVTGQVNDANQISQSAKNSYDRASSDARDAITLSMQIREELRQKNEEIVIYNEKITKSSSDLSRLKEAKRISEEELSSIDAKRIELINKKNSINNISSIENEIIQFRINLSLKDSMISDELNKESTLRVRFEEIEKKHIEWKNEKEKLSKKITSSSEHIENLKTRKIRNQNELEKIRNQPEIIAEKRGQLIETKSFAETERKFAADRVAESEQELKRFEDTLRRSQNDLANIRESKGRTEATKELAEARLKELEIESQERFNCLPNNIIETLNISDDHETMNKNFEKTERDLERFKQQRETLGAVNLRADLETKEIDDELEKMKTEKDDLESAIRKMRESIEELNKEGRARLLKAFETVNNHFKDVFVKLFNGGKAHLELVDADDPLEAGLEMMVSPPGKKLQSMSLLSGGEQALTAMSLIFAIFLTNPSPICVLDEVDAPLDDANVERFCNLLNDITDKTNTKFLIITHHALTMSRMDRLFGVTMAERGVSQIVSVDLKKAEEIGAVA